MQQSDVRVSDGVIVEWMNQNFRHFPYLLSSFFFQADVFTYEKDKIRPKGKIIKGVIDSLEPSS